MVQAITRMARECWQAKVGIADMMGLLRREFPMATRDEIEAGVADMLRGK